VPPGDQRDPSRLEDPRRSSRGRSPAASGQYRLIVSITIAVLALPILVDLVVSGRKRVFAYLAADSFYYLQVARNVVHHGSVSFDGRHATNGFQPLWQGVLSAAQGGASLLGVGPTGMLYASLLIGLGVLVGAVVLLASAFRAGYGHLTPVFVIVPLGFYAVLFAPIWIYSGALRSSGINPFEGPMPLYGTLWSYVNGMETPLVVAAFALLAWAFTKRPVSAPRSGLVTGVALSLLVLARLDLVFVAIGVLGTLGACAWIRRDRAVFRLAATAGVVVTVVLVAYVIVNRLYAGSWLPVSGTVKTTFPNPTLGNWQDLRSLLEHPTFLGPERWYRQFPTIVGALIAAAFLGTSRLPTLLRSRLESPLDRYRLLLSGTATGVIALSAYDFFFVANYNQGHWYYPVTTLFVSLAILDWLAKFRTPSVLVITTCVIVTLVAFVTLGRRADYHVRMADFYFRGAPLLTASYHGNVPNLLEVDDGIDLYALNAEGMSGVGLTLDQQGVQAYRADRLLQLAVQRGFGDIVSLDYLNATGLTDQTSSSALRARMEQLLTRPGHSAPNLSGYDFSVERRLPPGVLATQWPGTDGSYVVIRVRSR
jgi:hypothetical protein